MKSLALVIAVYLFPVAQVIANGPATKLSVIELVAWAACVSMAGGMAAAWRESNQCSVIVKTGLNTMVFGISISLLSSHWTSQSASLAWSAIGASGLLSLGGLAIVDWAIALFQKRIATHTQEVRIDESNQRPSDEER